MAGTQSFRRVLIVADESADWIVAGLRQLDRLALAIDEFAVENDETASVLVCIFWRPDLDQSQCWTPANKRLSRVTFTSDLDGVACDLVLSTRQFLYRNAVRQLMEASFSPSEAIQSPVTMESWKNKFCQIESWPRSRTGVWEYITDGNQIDEIEIEFLRASGKSQDGIVSRYLNRPLSRVVTRRVLRFPISPNAWTLLIFPIPFVAALILFNGTYWSFLVSLVLFQVFSVLDGCDGEIARAKFLESESGRRLDGLCDILSNVLLVVGLGFGLFRQADLAGHSGWLWLMEGFAAATLIGLNEFLLARRTLNDAVALSPSLGDTLYPRHRELVERSGMLAFGETFAFWLMQLTKRDVAMLFFVVLAAIGQPAWILHLLFVVTAISLGLGLNARRSTR